ncbi:MAG: J domain-containing protein [Pseudomonadota bacterium]
MVEAYPLHWPEGRARTKRPQRARFDTTMGLARDCLIDEIKRMGGTLPVISSNVRLRRDGLPYASDRPPEDTGVAVYFQYGGEQVCFACDQWDRVRDNIQGIRKTIEALRGIARWGTGDMLQRAFHGFAELPPPSHSANAEWHEILGVQPDAELEEAERAFRRRVREVHPDIAANPDEHEYHRLVIARKEAREALGGNT